MPLAWTNWSGSVSCTPQIIATPNSEAELIELVKEASRAGARVRVVGTGHSFLPLCAGDGVLISLDSLQGVISTQREQLTATVWAGTKIHQLGDPLWDAGMAMENMGDIDRQSIAGAISTGTHGTGRTLGNISTQVVGLRLITASGDPVECSPDINPEIFQAARVSLGAFGIITQITLRLLPAYQLHERTWVASFDECMDQLDQLIASNRHFEFFWAPREDACAMKALNPTTETAPGQRGMPEKVVGRLTRYVREERIDCSYRIFPSERHLRFNEMEFAVPEVNGPDCLREIRQLMQTKHADVAWPIEYRTLHADDIDLSPAYERATVTISIHQANDLPHQSFFADAEAIFRNHHGRPHWGKLHSHTACELQALYPRWDHFQTLRRQLDSGSLFLNDYLRHLFDCRG